MDKDLLELEICEREHGLFPKSYQLLEVLAANALYLELNRPEMEQGPHYLSVDATLH